MSVPVTIVAPGHMEGSPVATPLMIAKEAEEVVAGTWPAEDNPLVNSPHTAASIATGEWTDTGSVPFWVKASCALASERGLTGDVVLLATADVGAGTVVNVCAGGSTVLRDVIARAGHAEHFAHTDAALSMEHKRLGDNAVTECWAMTLERLTELGNTYEKDGAIWGDYSGDTVTFGRFIGTRTGDTIWVSFVHVLVSDGAVVMELERVGAYLEDKIVMVTGAGGSVDAGTAAQNFTPSSCQAYVYDIDGEFPSRINRGMVDFGVPSPDEEYCIRGLVERHLKSGFNILVAASSRKQLQRLYQIRVDNRPPIRSPWPT